MKSKIEDARTKERREDEALMAIALKEARKACSRGEVPVGAVVAIGPASTRKIIAKGYNQKESKNDPTAHAEMVALRKAAKKLRSWRLTDSTIYVTLEPCLMCMGALIQARVGRLVYASADPKAGACGSLYDVSNDKRLNHSIEVRSGVLAEETSELLSEFFRELRSKKA